MTSIIDSFDYDKRHRRRAAMPMIDVYAPANLFPPDADEQLVGELTRAVLRAEGVPAPGPLLLENTAAFVHRLAPSSVGTAARQPAPVVRVQIVTPPGALGREGQRQITREATEIVARLSGDASQAQRTWVILSEAAEGGWGIAGTALGKPEFADLARRAAAAAPK
jgi:phenylpyruvate tautomerase PptA (4-oxalocrotonate tautomerase family)